MVTSLIEKKIRDDDIVYTYMKIYEINKFNLVNLTN